MRKKWLLLLMGLVVIFMLAACGSKSQDDVVKELKGKQGDLTSYKVNATMTLKMGADSQVYKVEIWHKDPTFYRVNLKNAEKDQSQMILRNNQGVFVLTPALNKSFRFQSDWPQNSSQAYLYESLIKDIVADKEAKFTSTKDHYVFETKTRYQNNSMLPIQEIKLNKSDLSPAMVKVMDPDRNALVTVEFSKVTFNASFDKDDFDMKKNMTRAQLNLPAMATGGDQAFTVMYPTYKLTGTKLIGEKTINIQDGKRVVLTYDGKKSFTLVQEKVTAKVASTSPTNVEGDIVDLGVTIGAVSDHSLSWSHGGVDYMIASKNLTTEEMIEVAKSVQGDAVK
ncbi:outer membrane lipoprotein carrier protein LolA [Neobacillus sp. MM2021_6]|uniref:LolA family protein n=1 Tax=Bacillaceae TaxID=186817 RepID=UPI00140C644B|nr:MULTISPECIES: outer membrane lipoprotein carrier protein LolA [Bacillaceae]MBO0960457.1 outer membrane lipoprotein carrier protein LolA [Neobacillus sp. MM2021_6]NHC19616.1 outer membrane lipoprotein carrier protein LolA [Bacillus sp. MM2020_4]WML42121.1 outer membrane lipoprotein carrier protein LolA [Neobacillus sp. OS1-2]